LDAGRNHRPLCLCQKLPDPGLRLRHAITRQLAPAGDAQHIRAHTLLRQLLGRLDDFGQDGALTEQGHPLPRLRTVRGKPVAPAQHTRRRIGRQVGLGAVLVHQGDVIKQALADIAALERFIIDQLTPIPGIEKIRTSFTLKQVRYKTALPLPETT